MNDCIERFAGDLRACGIDEREIEHTARLYERALAGGAESAWREFYVATYVALSRSADRARPRSLHAVESLLRLLRDDLSAALFEAGTIARLGSRLSNELMRPGVDQAQHRHGNVGAASAVALSFGNHADDGRKERNHYNEDESVLKISR